MESTDVVIIGAGAAGLMCAMAAGQRGRRVIILDHANKPGKKILMSGGGRCNFTNLYCSPENFISHNPHFCKSALSRYTQWDFIELVKQHGIPYHEKTLGQLFCTNKSKDILELLLNECQLAAVDIRMLTSIKTITKNANQNYTIHSSRGALQCESLVIATGGLSIPTMGASPLGYQIAAQFGLNVWPTRAGLVPLTLHAHDKAQLADLAGIGVASQVQNAVQTFRENTLFTHRGLSGPAILQLSSYWQPGTQITLDLLPDLDLNEYLLQQKQRQPLKQINTLLNELLPKRLVETRVPESLALAKIADLTQGQIKTVAACLTQWALLPNGTEGYRTAEVTLGGVDCAALSSKTFGVLAHPGLHFIGEVLDVTGWLGGFNFQWAWSSGWAAGQVV